MLSPKRQNFAPCQSCHARAARIHALGNALALQFILIEDAHLGAGMGMQLIPFRHERRKALAVELHQHLRQLGGGLRQEFIAPSQQDGRLAQLALQIVRGRFGQQDIDANPDHGPQLAMSGALDVLH